MSKFSSVSNVSFAAFSSRLIDYATAAADLQTAKQWLTANAPKMSKTEKIEADGMVVNALEVKFSISATTSKRPLLSGWTFPGSEPAANAARVALSRARGILIKKEPVERDSEHSAAYAAFIKRITSDDSEVAQKARDEVTALFLMVKTPKGK